MNKKDEKGLKQGYWEISDNTFIWKGYYENGKAYGLWKRFKRKDGTLKGRYFYVSILESIILLWSVENNKISGGVEYNNEIDKSSPLIHIEYE